MSIRRCPNCHRKLLHKSSFLKQPFRVSIHCRYCGMEYVLKKGLVSSVLVIAVWFSVFLVFLVISSLGWDFPFNIMTGSLAVALAMFVTLRTGSLRKKEYSEAPLRSKEESQANSEPDWKRIQYRRSSKKIEA